MARSPPLPIDASFRQPQQSFTLLEASGGGPTAIATLASAQKSNESFADAGSSLTHAAVTGQPRPDNDMLAPCSGSAGSHSMTQKTQRSLQVEPAIEFSKAGPATSSSALQARLSAQQSTSDDDNYENAHPTATDLKHRRQNHSSSSSSSSSPPPLIGEDGVIRGGKKASGNREHNQTAHAQDFSSRSENVQQDKKDQSDEKKLTLQELLATNPQVSNRNRHNFESKSARDHNQIIIISGGGGGAASSQQEQTGRQQVRGHPSSLAKQQKGIGLALKNSRSPSRDHQAESLPFTSLYRAQQQQQQQAALMNHHSFYPQKTLDGFTSGRLQHTTQPTNGFGHGTDELRHSALGDDEPQSLTMREEFAKPDYKVNQNKSTKKGGKSGRSAAASNTSPANVVYPHHQYYATGTPNLSQQQQSQPAKEQNLPEYRHFFRPPTKKQQQTPAKFKGAAEPSSNMDCKQVVVDWFTTLSEPERINALTTVCPMRIENLLLWYRGELSTPAHQQTADYVNLHFSSSQNYFMTKEELMLIPITIQGKISPEYQAHHISPTAGYTPSAKNFYMQGRYPDQPLHMSSLYQPPGYATGSYGGMVDYNLGNLTRLKNMREFLSHIRLADYQTYLDTLTVDQTLVEEPNLFFEMMDELTDSKAFRKPITLTPVSQSKGGKLQVDLPWWANEHGKTANFFALWIAAMLEETLWTHFFYSLIVLNCVQGKAHTIKWEGPKTMRKHELANMFESRTDNTALQSQEDLSQYLKSIGKNGQKRLFEKLRERARTPPFALAPTPAAQQSQDESFEMSGASETKNKRRSTKNAEKSTQKTQSPAGGSVTQQTASAQAQQVDQDVKEIQEGILHLMKHNSQLHAIKYLAESPFGREGTRKDQLCREMLQLISEDLRLSVQNQLMNEEQRKASAAQQAKRPAADTELPARLQLLSPSQYSQAQSFSVQQQPLLKAKNDIAGTAATRKQKNKGAKARKEADDESKSEQKEEEVSSLALIQKMEHREVQQQQIVLTVSKRGGKGAKKRKAAARIATVASTAASGAVLSPTIASISIVQQEIDPTVSPNIGLLTYEFAQSNSSPIVMAASTESHQQQQQEQADIQVQAADQYRAHQNQQSSQKPSNISANYTTRQEAEAEHSPRQQETTGSTVSNSNKKTQQMDEYRPSQDDSVIAVSLACSPISAPKRERSLPPTDEEISLQAPPAKSHHQVRGVPKKQPVHDAQHHKVKTLQNHSQQGRTKKAGDLIQSDNQSAEPPQMKKNNVKQLPLDNRGESATKHAQANSQYTSPEGVGGSRAQRRQRKSAERQRSLVREYVSSLVNGLIDRVAAIKTASPLSITQTRKEESQEEIRVEETKEVIDNPISAIKKKRPVEEKSAEQRKKVKVQDDKMSTATAASVASDQSLVMGPTKSARRRKARKKGANTAELMNNFQRNMFNKQPTQSSYSNRTQQQNQTRKEAAGHSTIAAGKDAAKKTGQQQQQQRTPKQQQQDKTVVGQQATQQNSGRGGNGTKRNEKQQSGANLDTLSTSSSSATNIGQQKKKAEEEVVTLSIAQEVSAESRVQQLSIFNELNESLMTTTTAAGAKSEQAPGAPSSTSEQMEAATDAADEEQQPRPAVTAAPASNIFASIAEETSDELIDKLVFTKENIYSGEVVTADIDLLMKNETAIAKDISLKIDASSICIGTEELQQTSIIRTEQSNVGEKQQAICSDEFEEQKEQIEEGEEEQKSLGQDSAEVLTLEKQQTSKLSTSATAFTPTIFPPSSPIIDYSAPQAQAISFQAPLNTMAPQTAPASTFYMQQQMHNNFRSQKHKPGGLPYMQMPQQQPNFSNGFHVQPQQQNKLHHKGQRHHNSSQFVSSNTFEPTTIPAPQVQPNFGCVEPISIPAYNSMHQNSLVFEGGGKVPPQKTSPFQPNAYQQQPRLHRSEYQKPQQRRGHPSEQLFNEEKRVNRIEKDASIRNGGNLNAPMSYQKGPNRRQTNNTLSQSKKDTELFMQLKKTHSVGIGMGSENYLAPKQQNNQRGRVSSGNASPQGSTSSANGSAKGNNHTNNRRKNQRFKGGGGSGYDNNSNAGTSVYSFNDQQPEMDHVSSSSPQSANMPSNAIRLNAPPYDPNQNATSSGSDVDDPKQQQRSEQTWNEPTDQSPSLQSQWSSNNNFWKNKMPMVNGMQQVGGFGQPQMMPQPQQIHHHGGGSRLHNVVQNLFQSLATGGPQSPSYLPVVDGSNFNMNGPSTPVPFGSNNGNMGMPPNMFQGGGQFNSPVPHPLQMSPQVSISGFEPTMQRSHSYQQNSPPQQVSRGMQFETMPPEMTVPILQNGQSPAPVPNEYPQQLDYFTLDFETEFYKKFDADIKEYTTEITNRTAEWEPERNYVLERIQTISNKVFSTQTPKIKTFGSLMTGLANEQSDMDIVVAGLTIVDRYELIDYMNALANGLAESDIFPRNLIQDLKAIDTASIPVIKGNINLYSLRALRTGEEEHIADKEKSEGRMLALDITFDDSPPEQQQQETGRQQSQSSYQMGPGNLMGMQQFQTPQFSFPGQQPAFSQFGSEQSSGFTGFGLPSLQKTHLGLASTQLLKDYLSRYPCLKEVAVLLKRFLALHNLNVPYTGGISSYSLVLLIVGYMNCYKLQQSPCLTPSRLLMGFLDFYGNSFNPRQYGLNTINDESFYSLPMAAYNEMQFCIVDPVNPSNNTARNSQQTATILEKFRAIHRSLKLLSQKQQQRFLEGKSEEAQSALATLGGGSPTRTEEKASLEVRQPQNADDGVGQLGRGAELTDGALGQAAQQKAQEQQQKLPPAKGSAGQEGAAGASEKQTTRDVDPVLPSPSHTSTSVVGPSQAAAKRPALLSSIFDSFDFVARFLSLQQPQDDESPTGSSPGLSSKGSRV